MNKMIEKAKIFCIEKHKGQKRKWTGEPYSTHPIGTYEIAKKYTNDEEVLVGCLLHDTIEDCGVTYEEIMQKFSKGIADIVKGVTHELGSGWVDTRVHYLANLSLAPKKSVFVALADKIHNLDCIVDALDNGFVEVDKLQSPYRIEWFNNSVALIARERLKSDAGMFLINKLQGKTATFMSKYHKGVYR